MAEKPESLLQFSKCSLQVKALFVCQQTGATCWVLFPPFLLFYNKAHIIRPKTKTIAVSWRVQAKAWTFAILRVEGCKGAPEFLAFKFCFSVTGDSLLGGG